MRKGERENMDQDFWWDACKFATPKDIYRPQQMVPRHDLFVQDGQARCVDIAFRYAGMGHVRVLAYDPVSGHVFEQVDGGANGYDRVANRKTRIETDVASVAKTPFETWWETLHANLY